MKDISDKRVNISLDNPSITFDKNKCDECSICKNICKFNIGVYGFSNDDYPCINCGSCTLVCPNKCLSEKDETDLLDKYLNSNKIIVMQTAPAVRVSLGEEFNMKPGANVEGKMITALKMIGADYVLLLLEQILLLWKKLMNWLIELNLIKIYQCLLVAVLHGLSFVRCFILNI